MDEATTTTGPVVIEGTWDEIAARADELRGRWLRVEVVAPPPPLEPPFDDLPDTTGMTFTEALNAIRESVKHLDDTPIVPRPDKPDPYGDDLMEKHRKNRRRFADQPAEGGDAH